MNWDPHNAYGKETRIPTATKLLPQTPAEHPGEGQGRDARQPGKGRLEGHHGGARRDGYKGKLGLETHIFDGTLIAAAHASMEEILRIVGEVG